MKCPHCDNGYVTLLTSREPCDHCNRLTFDQTESKLAGVFIEGKVEIINNDRPFGDSKIDFTKLQTYLSAGIWVQQLLYQKQDDPRDLKGPDSCTRFASHSGAITFNHANQVYLYSAGTIVNLWTERVIVLTPVFSDVRHHWCKPEYLQATDPESSRPKFGISRTYT